MRAVCSRMAQRAAHVCGARAATFAAAAAARVQPEPRRPTLLRARSAGGTPTSGKGFGSSRGSGSSSRSGSGGGSLSGDGGVATTSSRNSSRESSDTSSGGAGSSSSGSSDSGGTGAGGSGSDMYLQPQLYDDVFGYRDFAAEAAFVRAAYKRHCGGRELGSVLELG